MMCSAKSDHFRVGDRTRHCLILNIAAVICCVDLIIKGLAVDGKLLTSFEANSSPSHIIATKGSAVWLHWNYTYIGDGPTETGITLTYKEQLIRVNSTSQPTIQTLAKRTGQNGALTLESSIPTPFNGRVEVISSNSTLVIHNLQYNDSKYQFSSYVTVDADLGAGARSTINNLRPVVSIKVNGIPDFVARPPSTLDVNEGSNLQLSIEVDGNPQPSADFSWPHLTGSSPTNVPSVQLYPFVYSSTYTLNNIDASYCGRILQTTLKNSIGSSSDTASTNVNVLLKLDMDFGLKAEKIGGAKCVEVKWNKVESGVCYVKYEVVLKSASGSNEYSNSGYNIGEMTMCRFTTYSNVTDVQLTVTFKSTSKHFTAEVSDTTLSTPAPTPPDATYSSSSRVINMPTAEIDTQTTPSTTHSTTSVNNCGCNPASSDEWKSRDSAFLAVNVILIIMLIILSVIIILMRRRQHSAKSRKQTRQAGQAEMHYMDLKIRSKEAESNYAKLQGEYEEVEQNNP